jgi:hypothetical protein
MVLKSKVMFPLTLWPRTAAKRHCYSEVYLNQLFGGPATHLEAEEGRDLLRRIRSRA